MTRASYVVIARADHLGDVIVECQMTIIDNTKHTRMVVDISTVVSARRMPAVLSNWLGRRLHPTDFHQSLHGSCRPRHSHVCKAWNWNYHRLRFYRGSISSFSIDSFMGLTTVQRYCAACDGYGIGLRSRGRGFDSPLFHFQIKSNKKLLSKKGL